MNAKLPALRTGGSVGRSGESDVRNFHDAHWTGAVVSRFGHTHSVRRETVEETQSVVIERCARRGASHIG